MSEGRITKLISYDKVPNLGYIVSDKNCLPYTLLYFTYISMFKLKYDTKDSSDIDYSALLTMLSGYPYLKKKRLKSIFGTYDHFDVADYRAMFEEELAPFNTNIGICRLEDDFMTFAEDVYQNIVKFTSPVFYLLDHQIMSRTPKPDTRTPHKNWHVMGFYLASPTEIHFFDSVTGLYKLTLDEGDKVEDLARDLRRLIHKRWSVRDYLEPDKDAAEGTSTNKNVFYNFTASRFVDSHTATAKRLKSALLSCIDNHSFDVKTLDAAIQEDAKKVNFFKRCFYTLQILENQFDVEPVVEHKM